MVKALGRFYRLSLSKGKEVIPLSDEIEQARLYVEIQNMRFENRVKAVWQLDETAMQCHIIKIVLQPLIENAIIHGIFEKPEKYGVLRVCTHRADDSVYITVEDNGKGMDEETLRANFLPTPDGGVAETTGGYGVRNVCDRLNIAYGDPYGLTCESVPGEGTRVTVRIPILE